MSSVNKTDIYKITIKKYGTLISEFKSYDNDPICDSYEETKSGIRYIVFPGIDKTTRIPKDIFSECHLMVEKISVKNEDDKMEF